MKLLICIAFHYNPDRIKYLTRILDAFLNEYKVDVNIIVDTNNLDIEGYCDLESYIENKKIQFYVHEDLKHPFHLTWMHRKHIKDHINNYDCFAYFEDDMYLPFENFQNYLENFKLLWPDYVPSFVRIETKREDKFVADIHEKQKFICILNRKRFAELKSMNNYNAFWILPAKELKETMKDDFVKLSDGREFAASYVAWTLGKKTFVEIENITDTVSEKCYSYHLPNNAPFVNLKVNEIFL